MEMACSPGMAVVEVKNIIEYLIAVAGVLCTGKRIDFPFLERCVAIIKTSQRFY